MSAVTDTIANSQTYTCALASLTTNSARQTTALTGQTDLDHLAQFVIKSPASGTSTTGYVEIRAIASADAGTSYTESGGATDAGITLTSPPNAPLVGVINMVANATTYKSSLFSVAAAFGGTLPDRYALVVVNKSGGTLDSTEGNHLKIFEKITGNVV